jgi:serine/threonine protein kinase
MLGRRIGHYRLTQRIGEGGMGEVYLAEREDEFRQRVAIKLIRQGVSNPEVIRRFLIERQTLAALNHPHIVRLVDGGTTEEGLPYLVVDYVEGVPIDRYCEEHKLNITARLRLLLDVCIAVHHAHQNLVVHCDLKPSNILVNSKGEPMLLDFGIAKLLDPVSIGVTAQAAQTRQRAFTPDYASPEQLRGQPVTTASDTYALGVILYDLLTGHSPYGATSNASLADWIRSVCERDAEPPSTVIRRTTEVLSEEDDKPPEKVTPERVSATREGDPQTLHRRLRGDLDAIVLKALRKDPRDRYASVDQLAEDIRRHLAGLPVAARKNTTTYVMRKFLQRNKLSMAAAALVLITITAGLASTLWQSRVAARRFEEVRRLAHTFLFDVHDSIQNLPGSTPARSLIAKTGTDYLDRLARDARNDPSLQLELADGYLKIGEVEGNPYSSNLGDSAGALESYRKAFALAEAVVKRSPRDTKALRMLARSHSELASLLPFRGKSPEGLQHAETAVKLFKQISDAKPDDVEARGDLARGYETMGDILGGVRRISLGRVSEAKAAYQKSLSTIPDLPPGAPDATRNARGKSLMLTKLADLEEQPSVMLEKYGAALRMAERLSLADPNDMRTKALISSLWNKIARAQSTVGDNKQALESFGKARDLNEAALRADPTNEQARTNAFVTQKNLGDLYFYSLNNYPEALRCYRRVGELLEAQSKADTGNIILKEQLSENLTYISSCLVYTGQPAEARRAAQRGLAIAKEVADHPGATWNQMYNYAWLVVTIEPTDLRNPTAALPYARKAVEKGGGSDALAYLVLGQAQAGTGDYARAVQSEEKALSLSPTPEPGKPTPHNRAIVERLLDEYRKELKKRSGG